MFISQYVQRALYENINGGFFIEFFSAKTAPQFSAI